MREVQFILPLLMDSVSEIEKFEKGLAERFGGFTATVCRGIWVNDADDMVMDTNITYTVAIDENSAADQYDIAAMAMERAIELKQEALYFKYTNGMVTIMDTGVKA